MKPIVLKSGKEEAADCRAACANLKVGDLVNFCHHEEIVEILREPAENRISYILTRKFDNVPLRLRLFRPLKADKKLVSTKTWQKAYAEYVKANAEYVKARDEYSACALSGSARAELNTVYKKSFERFFGTTWEGDIFKTFGRFVREEKV